MTRQISKAQRSDVSLRKAKSFWAVVFAGSAALWAPVVKGADASLHLTPEEYLSTGEQSVAMANGGSLSSAGYSAVRANPGMLATEKQYTLGGGYHWPAHGRDYYQAGVVDSKTSSIAAALSYSSSLDNYQGTFEDNGEIAKAESPVKRRVGLALAQSFQKLSLGLAGSFVEAADPAKTLSEDDAKLKGFTFGAGGVWTVRPNLRVGASVENLANKKIAFAAPTIYRAGLVWGAVKDFSVYVDLRQREEIPAFEGAPPALSLFEDGEGSPSRLGAEQSLTVGSLMRVYDLLKLSLGLGTAKQGAIITNTAAGGLALTNKNFVLAYGLQRPDLTTSEVHHTVSLGVDIAL